MRFSEAERRNILSVHQSNLEKHSIIQHWENDRSLVGRVDHSTLVCGDDTAAPSIWKKLFLETSLSLLKMLSFLLSSKYLCHDLFNLFPEIELSSDHHPIFLFVCYHHIVLREIKSFALSINCSSSSGQFSGSSSHSSCSLVGGPSAISRRLPLITIFLFA